MTAVFKKITKVPTWAPGNKKLKLIIGSFRSFTNIQNPVRCGITAGGYIGVFSRILDVLNSYSSYEFQEPR